MPRHRGMHRTVALTLTLALAACAGSPTAPAPARLAQPGLAHPAATFNQLQAINAVTSTTIFESFSVLAPYFAAPGTTAARSLALATLPRELAARYAPWHTQSVRRSPSPRQWRGGQGVRTTRGGQRVGTAALGSTFVWDPNTNAYVASPDSGAPANGERFTLYAISQRTGLPSVPLTSIGYVDLTDASAGATAVTLVGTPAGGAAATYASYNVTADGASLAGYVTDGTTRLDMTVHADSTTSPGTLSEQTAIAVAGQDLH